MEKQVYEHLYGDKNTRLFTYWTVRVLIFDFLPALAMFIYTVSFLKSVCFFLYFFFFFLNFFSSLQDDSYQNTGCYNLACSGFVQVDNQIAMGASVAPYSNYDGTQRSVKFYVWKVVQYFNLITLSSTLTFWIHIVTNVTDMFEFLLVLVVTVYI